MKICWFTTGRDKEAFTLLKEVVETVEKGIIQGEISLIFMNREKGESDTSDEIISFAEDKGIPLELLSTKKFRAAKGLTLSERRALFDEQVEARIEKYPFDLIFQAGYMLIISPVLHDSYTILNIHPSLPGAYKGKREDVVKKTIEDGERNFGAMVHKVNALLNEGPPISFVRLTLQGIEVDLMYQNAFRGDKSSKEMLMRIMGFEELSMETPLVIQTLALMSSGEIELKGDEVHYRGSPVQGGVDLTEIVKKAIGGLG